VLTPDGGPPILRLRKGEDIMKYIH
jgi:hypothetical protein